MPSGRAAERIFRSRRVVLPDGERPARVRVRDGRIDSIEDYATGPPVTDELGELVLMPGLVDPHVHVNEPGRADWEGFATATRAAAAGGITTIVDMPLNSSPPTTRLHALSLKRAAMAGKLFVDAGLWGGLVAGGLAELEPLAESGVLGFKSFLCASGVDDFEPVSMQELEQALPRIAALDVPLLVHAEDPRELRDPPLDAAGTPEGSRRYADWLASRPGAAERAAVSTVCERAARHGTRVHIVHVSSAESLPVLAAARAAGVRVTAETCPHYLTFAAEQIEDGATLLKCAPPIRGALECDHLWRALAGGELQMVASDHSPCPPRLKHLEDGDFFAAWGGIASLEASLSVVWTGAASRGIGLASVVGWMASATAGLAGLGQRKGQIATGFDADLVAFDPDTRWVLNQRRLQQRHPISPYHSMTLRGRVRRTWLRGELVFDGDAFPSEPAGRWLHRDGRALDPASPLP